MIMFIGTIKTCVLSFTIYRNPEVAFRPKFSDLALMLVGDRKEVLGIPQEDLATHLLAGVLGASLEAGEGMHLDLQNRYVFN